MLDLLVGAVFTVCFDPSFRPDIPLFKRFVKWWPLANRASSKPLDNPVDVADKIIAICYATVDIPFQTLCGSFKTFSDPF